ncbi:crotonase/enoyl-CoA hydratase family protein [Ciceribacter azotifigens]|uniref:crotonase/enoyl-CoA hydratase family protein n=1 Tax=Ciceribacter azotifigens TaxID=2069303 RepID=UPI003A8B800D
MTEFETILIDTDERGIARLTLNRPDKHNALNARMIAELTRAAEILGADESLRAVVLAGNGASFCAGGDLGWMREQRDKDRAGKMQESRALSAMFSALNALPKPLIGRVHGNAYGGGIGLMAVCDIVVSVGTARFALTETRLGLIPATIGPFVVRRIGEGYARQVFFTAKPFDAAFALRCGLVSSVTEPEQLDACVEVEVAAILKTRPGAVAAAKALCLELGGQSLSGHFERTAELLTDRWESAEAAEGIEAFLAR